MSCSWVKMYLLMGHGGSICIGKNIWFICIYFFLDTSWICIQRVYRYWIRIQVSDALWVEVFMFQR
jgi:hypothetical protein